MCVRVYPLCTNEAAETRQCPAVETQGRGVFVCFYGHSPRNELYVARVMPMQALLPPSTDTEANLALTN